MKFTPPEMGKLTPKNVILIAAGILLLIALGTSVFIVDQAERAVITRFGRYIGIRGPGLNFRLPFGIDRNYTVNTRQVQQEEFGFRSLRGGTYIPERGESIMLTGDLNIVDVTWIIQYRIEDPRAWVFNVRERRETIRDVSRSVINMLVGDRAIMDIMGRERSAIEYEALILMNETFRLYGLGINVITVELQNITPPVGDRDLPVMQAFEDVNRAMQDRERLINEGLQAFNEEIPRARGEAQRMVEIAKGYAVERINMAHGGANRFLAVLEEYRRAPEVTRQRLYYEMIEEVFRSEEGMILLDRNLQNFLPLLNMGGR